MSDLLCEFCGCPGNKGCTYPPEGEVDCRLHGCGMCHCCATGKRDRMTYRPEEDGQTTMEGV